MITFVAFALAVIPILATAVWTQDRLTGWKWRAIARERRDVRWTAADVDRPLPLPRNVKVHVIALLVRGEA